METRLADTNQTWRSLHAAGIPQSKWPGRCLLDYRMDTAIKPYAKAWSKAGHRANRKRRLDLIE